MRNYSIFINEEQLRLYTAISGSFDWAYITPHVITAQDLKIQQILGNSLYLKIHNDIYNEIIAGDYLFLLDNYIIRTLAHWTFYYALPYLPSKIVQSSLIRLVSDTTEGVEQDEVTVLKKHEESIAENYNQRLIDYLKANTDKYPEYKTEVKGEIKANDDGNYDFGFNLSM